jgi:MFS family permease
MSFGWHEVSASIDDIHTLYLTVPCGTRSDNNCASYVHTFSESSDVSPQITNDFHTLSDGGWYGSAYFLATTVALPTWGKIFQTFNVKGVYALVMITFAAGSLPCAVSQSSPVFIIGRSITGLSGAGISAGALTIIVNETTLEFRALFLGIFTALTAVYSSTTFLI